MRVLHGKGDQARTVALAPEAFALVERWLDRRTKLGLGTRRRLFCTLKGGPMATAYVRGLCKRLARKAGVEKRVHPHGFRHALAAGLAMNGTPVNVIQAQLGHASLATTDRYLRRIAPADLLAALKLPAWTPPR